MIPIKTSAAFLPVETGLGCLLKFIVMIFKKHHNHCFNSLG